MRNNVYIKSAVIYVVPFVLAFSCGGRIIYPDCGELSYCAETDVCCQHGWTCGDGHNGCPFRGCCEPSRFPKETYDDDSGEFDATITYPPSTNTTGTSKPVESKQ